jgi:DNA-binding NarL/FixJ family response regulator
MSPPRLVLIIESDSNAVAQMRRVLAGMAIRVVAVADEEALGGAVAELLRAQTAPSLLIARVALPTGSGIRMLEETAAHFPDAQQIVISHHPRNLLLSVPGFLDHAGNFLKAEFTDDQFRATVERCLARGCVAG